MNHYTPDGWPNVIPRIFVDDTESLVRFMRTVFHATGDYNDQRPTELRIGDSMIMISDTSERPPFAACLYVYVPDVDEAWQRAVSAGSRIIETVTDLPYGDRRGSVEDLWGNVWQIATRL